MDLMRTKQLAKFAVPILSAFLLIYEVGNVYCATVHENSVDLHSLLDFKQGVNDPNGALRTWNISTHFCRWKGVNCSDARPWRVTGLNLTRKGLAGKISPSLGNLTSLDMLDLSYNNFDGPLPLLNRLQRLKFLNLKSNHLQGVIPDGLTNCTDLLFLDLSKNFLTGVIPPSIDSLSKLIGLRLGQNNLTGTIPTMLTNITTLQTLDLIYGQLTGKIPDELWQMPNIEELDLGGNNLSGGISQTFPNISSLQYLDLAINMLDNTLPSNIGDALPNLVYISLAGNSFEGQIPSSLGNASGLFQIDLSSNNFNGQVPSSLGMLSGLIRLNVESNMLNASDNEGWDFFNALSNCRNLEQLSFTDNQLQGVIPNSVGNLSVNLQYLLMSENKLSGVVPPSIGNLTSLIELGLDANSLTGPIDEWIGKQENLTSLHLETNNFTGTIPLSLANLTKLTRLYLANNAFDGIVTPNLGRLQPLLELDLSNNNLQGSIPPELGNLKQLYILDLSSNKFSGAIPETLGQCQNLVILQMEQNVLTGNIPTTFTNLNSLSLLNLSHNALSGPLPAVLNDLKLLTKLDLSYNNFEGEIPRNGIFDNSTVVSLDGNAGLCGGAMTLRMRPCPVSHRAISVNRLIKILIPIFGFMSLILLIYFLLLGKKRSRRTSLSEPSFGEHFEKVSYNDLAQATRDFSEFNLIGRGSYGSVYRGKLKESKIEVAVKVFDLEMHGAERSFMSECEALRSIQHRNLLSIRTACSTGDNTGRVFKALVFDYMPNGNLDMWLHHKEDEKTPNYLNLTQRISIAVNIADALDYLHHDCGRTIVHSDLKPSNILLDDDMNALLGDFGIARLYLDSQSTYQGSVSTIGLKGTIGYIPPGI